MRESGPSWKKITLGALCADKNGIQTGPFGSQLHANEYVEAGVPVIMPKDMVNQRISIESIARITQKRADDLEAHKLREGDIVFGRRGDIGRCAVITKKEAGWICGTGCLRVRLNNDVSPEFVIYLLTVPHTIYWLNANAVGQTMLNLNTSILGDLPLSIPPLEEQQKIAAFLGAVDAKLDALRRKRELLADYKRGVMQKLFSQEIRFTNDDGQPFPEWQRKRIGLLIEEFSEQSQIQDEFEVLTSARIGLVRQKDYYESSRITDRNNVGFNIIPPGYITYRSRSDVREFYFNENNLGITGIVSVYYPVFRFIEGNNKFFVEFLARKRNYIGKFSVGTSQTVLSVSELKRIQLLIPSQEEQRKIADFLTAIDNKVTAVNQQIGKIETFKKGLLQQMFV